jgi:undecaprenyl-diphosphatase
MEYLESIDRQLLLLINGLNSPFFDYVFHHISQTITGMPLYLFIIYYFFKKFPKPRAFQYTVVLVLSVALADLTSVHLFKDVFERYRPSHNLDIADKLHFVNDYRGGKYGFVSSHAANLFALATFLMLVFKRNALTIFVFIWACLGSYSRMYLGVHYPSDIIGGALLGSLIANILYRFYFVNMNRTPAAEKSKMVEDL